VLKASGHPIITQQVSRHGEGRKPFDEATLVVSFAAKRGPRRAAVCRRACRSSRKPTTAAHPFDETTLDIPLGSGPYKVSKFEVNRFIEFERVRDWWGADLPVNRGSYNFDALRFDFLPRS